MTNSHQYTFADVVRYAHREMTPKETNDFENALLQDPFLGDIVEEYLKTVEADNKSLHTDRVMPEAELATKFAAFEKHVEEVANNYPKVYNLLSLRIAAMFIVIIGAALVIFYVLPTTTHRTRLSVGSTHTSAGADSIIVIQPVKDSAAIMGKKRFKLSGTKAYFYSNPMETAKRRAYAAAQSSTELFALHEQNGFIYVSVSNQYSANTTGWLRKADLVESKH